MHPFKVQGLERKENFDHSTAARPFSRVQGLGDLGLGLRVLGFREKRLRYPPNATMLWVNCDG